MTKYIIVDLDGTLCDTSHRQHFMEQTPKDWNSFYAGISDDPIHKHIDKLIRRYRCDTSGSRIVDIVFLSGRPDKYEQDTLKWLRTHGYHTNMFELHMRKTGDYRPDYVVKLEIATENNLTPDNVEFILDDRSSVVQMWRAQGFKCLQVANGDF